MTALVESDDHFLKARSRKLRLNTSKNVENQNIAEINFILENCSTPYFAICEITFYPPCNIVLEKAAAQSFHGLTSGARSIKFSSLTPVFIPFLF